MNRLLFLLALASTFTTTGCDTGRTDTDLFEVRPGEIFETAMGEERAARVDIAGVTVSDDNGLADSVASGPITVWAGAPFNVTVYTFTGPCHRAASSEVSVEGGTARVAVQDSVYLDWCAALRTFTPRTDEIVFDEPGEAEVIVRGVKPDLQTGARLDRELRFDVIVEG